MNQALRDEGTPLGEAASFLMAGGWAAEEAVRPLLEYARGTWKTSRPLEMAGFDTGRPRRAAAHFESFLRDVLARAPSLALAEEDWELVNRLTERAYGFSAGGTVDEVERGWERGLLEDLLERLREARRRGRAGPLPARARLGRALRERRPGQRTAQADGPDSSGTAAGTPTSRRTSGGCSTSPTPVGR